MAGLLVEVSDLLVIQFVDMVKRGAQVAFQYGERRAQFMRNIGHQTIAQFGRPLQIISHFVESMGQVINFAAIVRNRDPCAQVTTTNRLGGIGKFRNRGGQNPAGEHTPADPGNTGQRNGAQ